MRADRLGQMLRGGSGPCLVCAQAGNVNTGAVDPIAEIAEVTRERGAWLHVDGAFGMWAAASPSRRPLLDGIDAVGGTRWHGRTAMRISVSTWSTSPADIDPSAAAFLRALDSGTASERLGGRNPGALPPVE